MSTEAEAPCQRALSGKMGDPAAATAAPINGGDCDGRKTIYCHVYLENDPDKLVTVDPGRFRQANNGG